MLQEHLFIVKNINYDNNKNNCNNNDIPLNYLACYKNIST